MANLPHLQNSVPAAGSESIALTSSFLASASYDPASLQMNVHFKNGDQHTYYFVSPATWQQFKLHPSKGQGYSLFVKGKHQAYAVKRGLKVSDIDKAKKGKSPWFYPKNKP